MIKIPTKKKLCETQLSKEKYPAICRDKKLKKSLQAFTQKYGPALKKLAKN